jgi:hypothetical protein
MGVVIETCIKYPGGRTRITVADMAKLLPLQDPRNSKSAGARTHGGSKSQEAPGRPKGTWGIQEAPGGPGGRGECYCSGPQGRKGGPGMATYSSTRHLLPCPYFL